MSSTAKQNAERQLARLGAVAAMIVIAGIVIWH
jgi:hypothetical protein